MGQLDLPMYQQQPPTPPFGPVSATGTGTPAAPVAFQPGQGNCSGS